IYTLTGTNPLSGCKTVVEVTVNACGTGISDKGPYDDFISVFPNPVKDQLGIEFINLPQNARLEIFSPDGTLLRKLEITAEKTLINLQNEQAGLYLIRLLLGEKTIKEAKILKN
ncbi:MAG TPA: T9SS type A sorting domain-containing protein, partial [Bacteroidia bacterium]|nr:T9SS type A sorting domain-containing protein [Bacteroidia bacterium]